MKSFEQLVEAYEISEKYAEFLRTITGREGTLVDEWDVGGRLYEVIRENSIYAGRTDDYAEDTFSGIVNAVNISTKEKVRLLLGEDENEVDGYADLDE